jgi:hypothetical protein
MIPKMLRTSGIFVLVILLYSQNLFSFSVIIPPHKVEIKSPDYLKGSVFVNLTAREFSVASGKKLNLFQKIYFKAIQHRVKHDLKKNPDLQITDYFDPVARKFKFDALWFVICAFIGPLGLLFAYTSPLRKGSRTTKKDRLKSAWLGLALFILWFGFIFIF